MKFDAVHHIAIIGSDYDKTREFYVEKLGFEQVDEHIRPEKMIFSSMSKKAIWSWKFSSNQMRQCVRPCPILNIQVYAI